MILVDKVIIVTVTLHDSGQSDSSGGQSNVVTATFMILDSLIELVDSKSFPSIF